MFKLNGFKILCALAVMIGTANAADIVIDNQNIPGSDISSINISPSTGNLFVTTIPGYTVTPVVLNNNVAITNFTVSPATSVAGDTITVSWNTANAVSCTPSGGVGGWKNTVITLPSGTKKTAPAVLGTFVFTLTCTGSGGGTAVKTASLTINSPNAVAINNFTSSLATIEAGSTTTLSWQTTNATSCTPSGGTAVWAATNIGVPNGSVPISIATAGTYGFTLTCHDANGGTDAKTAVVIVSAVPTSCPTTSLLGTITPWKNFWLVDFPNPGYDNRYATIARFGYLALEFNTGSVVSHGKMSSIETTVTDGVRLGAFSKCPGDFDVAPECDYVWGIGGGVNWATDGTTGCQLEPNTKYYFNITFTDGVDATQSSCSSSPCITTLQHAN